MGDAETVQHSVGDVDRGERSVNFDEASESGAHPAEAGAGAIEQQDASRDLPLERDGIEGVAEPPGMVGFPCGEASEVLVAMAVEALVELSVAVLAGARAAMLVVRIAHELAEVAGAITDFLGRS